MKLKEGEKAPSFKAVDQDGKPITLGDFAGKKVILYFYPKDDTPGCTAEACNLRDNFDDLLEKGYRIVGVSADDHESHKKFRAKYKLPFPLIADPDMSIIKAYGVWGKKKFMGREYNGILRTTFIISENGDIEKILTKVKTKDHADQILAEMGK